MGSERRAREADRQRVRLVVRRQLRRAGAINQAADADKVWMRERGLDVIAEQYRRQEVALLQVPPLRAAKFIPHGMVSLATRYPTAARSGRG